MNAFDFDGFYRSAALVFVLLNPFLMSIYLQDLMQDLDRAALARVLLRASLISSVVFAAFAFGGEAVFTVVLQVQFHSFLVFGGLIFLLIGVRYILLGSRAIRDMRGKPEHVAGSVAMPFMIGPGTISASVWAGTEQGPVWGTLALTSGVVLAGLALLTLKTLYDRVRAQHTALVERYVDIAGRITALWTGTFAVEMIVTGLRELWPGF